MQKRSTALAQGMAGLEDTLRSEDDSFAALMAAESDGLAGRAPANRTERELSRMVLRLKQQVNAKEAERARQVWALELEAKQLSIQYEKLAGSVAQTNRINAQAIASFDDGPGLSPSEATLTPIPSLLPTTPRGGASRVAQGSAWDGGETTDAMEASEATEASEGFGRGGPTRAAVAAAGVNGLEMRGGWRCKVDAGSGRLYFLNDSSRRTQWQLPQEALPAQLASDGPVVRVGLASGVRCAAVPLCVM